MHLIFGLNALLRKGNSQWDSSNAELILNYMDSQNYSLSWELGNGNVVQYLFIYSYKMFCPPSFSLKRPKAAYAIKVNSREYTNTKKTQTNTIQKTGSNTESHSKQRGTIIHFKSATQGACLKRKVVACFWDDSKDWASLDYSGRESHSLGHMLECFVCKHILGQGRKRNPF